MIGAGRKPRRRVADLMIAAIAIAEELPLFTTNPDDYKGLESLLTVVPVTRPAVPHDRSCGADRTHPRPRFRPGYCAWTLPETIAPPSTV